MVFIRLSPLVLALYNGCSVRKWLFVAPLLVVGLAVPYRVLAVEGAWRRLVAGDAVWLVGRPNIVPLPIPHKFATARVRRWCIIFLLLILLSRLLRRIPPFQLPWLH